jgi:16S rRNA (cytidine1402-2'-O)-methyltransferase
MGEDEIVGEEGSAHATGLRAAAEIERLAGSPIAPGLYLVSTPIGNLADITLRALSVLVRADVIYCEDTRHSRTLLSHYSIRATLRPYHEHNAEEQRPRILAELGAGKTVALISDAGTPLISDPGFKLVRDAAVAEHLVVAIPGASAVLTALPVSGLPTDAFFFAGFLPTREGARRTRIEELAGVPGSLVFFESPGRAGAALKDLADVLGTRPAALARELTKLHEDVVRGSLAELAERFANVEPKGEVVLVVGPPAEGMTSDADIEAQLETALKHWSVRDAAKAVSDALKVPKARVYDIALKVKQREKD